MSDGELITSPQPAEPGARAWLDLSVKVGNLTEQIAAERRERDKPRALRHLAVAGAAADAAGDAVVLNLGGPAAGREWSVRRLSVFDLSSSTGAATAASNTFAAGAAGTVSSGQGTAMTGFDITTAPVAAAQSGTVSVLGLAVGTLSYELNEPVGGGILQVRFPDPLPASDALHFPQVSVPAIVSGAAYAVTVYGVTDAPTAVWYVGQVGAVAQTDAVWRVNSIPFQEKFSGDHITVTAQTKLLCTVSGLLPGDNVIARADVLDYPLGAGVLTDPI